MNETYSDGIDAPHPTKKETLQFHLTGIATPTPRTLPLRHSPGIDEPI